MTRILKTFGLALVAMTALSAVMAAGASAQAGTGLTTFNTTTKTHETANLNISRIVPSVFRVTAGSSELTCESETFSGTTSGTEETPKAKPTYGSCHAIIGGSKIAAEISTNGCEYQFHVDSGGPDTYAGHASIKGCTNADKSITITLPATGCVIHVPEAKNQNINGITYHNNTAASPTDVEITVESTNLNSTATSGLLSCGVAAGEHTTGTFTGKYTVKATNTVGTPIDVTVNKLAT